jgi:YD repeat-containing protein
VDLGHHVGFVLSLDLRGYCVDAQVVKVQGGRMKRNWEGYSADLFGHRVRHAGHRGRRGGIEEATKGKATPTTLAGLIDGWVELRRDPFGVERTTRYRPEGWIERVRTSGPSGLVDETVYAGHDALGNPASITTAEGTTQLEYDPRHRVRQIAYPASSGWPACGTACERFEYDRAGNRTLHQKDGAVRRAVICPASLLG